MMNWTDMPKRMVRVEMTKRGMTYADMVVALRRIGIIEEERNLRNKIARSTFTATFLIQCLVALDVLVVDLKSYGLPALPDPNTMG